MAKCIRIRKKKRQYCSGDMIDEIIIQNRTLVPSSPDATDFTEVFDGDRIVQSAVNTVSGKTYFDGVNEETPITHSIGFRFDETVTSESWILYKARRLDILKLENLDERSEWMQATCIDRGLETKAASEL